MHVKVHTELNCRAWKSGFANKTGPTNVMDNVVTKDAIIAAVDVDFEGEIEDDLRERRTSNSKRVAYLQAINCDAILL